MNVRTLCSAAFALLLTCVVPACAEGDSSDRMRVGLALGGGGMRGACHIGVLRAFEREGIPVDVVSGTSMGAIVGGLYCAGVPLNDIETLLTKGKLSWSLASGVPVARLPGMMIGQNTEGVFTGKHMAHTLRKLIPEERRDIDHLERPFSAVVVDLLDGKERALRKGDLAQAIQASSAVPLLCQPVRTPDGVFVDGGVLNNLPVSHTRELGADFVIAVEVDGHPPVKPDETRTAPEVCDRVLGLMLQRIDKDERKDADFLMSPEVSNVNFFSMKKSEIKAAIEEGDRAAMAVIPQIKQEMSRRTKTAQLSSSGVQ